MTTANVRTNTNSITREARNLAKTGNILSRAFDRLKRPRGATSGGGGRGAFAGTLTDFATRDEFIGRSGTIYRAITGGHLIGAGLAFMSIDEISTRMLRVMQGKAEWTDMITEAFEFLVPTLLRDTLPKMLDENNRRLRNQMKHEIREQWKQSQYQYRLENDEGLARNVRRFRQARFENSEEYRRQLAGAQSLRGNG